LVKAVSGINPGEALSRYLYDREASTSAD